MEVRRDTLTGASVVMAGSLLLFSCTPQTSSDGYPRMPIELVVPFQAGGGSDNLARTLQMIIARDNLVSQPVTVVNKSGGAGAIGLAYVAGKRGDSHTLMTTIDTLVSVPLQPGYKGPTYRDLTLLAILALDDLLIVVPARSQHSTIEGLLADAKAHPGKLKLATNAAGGEDHIFGGLIEAATGVRFTYVHTRGGAEAMQHVMGGHVDIAVPNPSEMLSQLQGGLVRALAVGAPARLEILPQVPTLKERGIGVEYRMFRGLALPGGVPREVIAFWEDVLGRVVQSERWKRDYLARLALTPHFKTGEEAIRFVVSVEKLYRATLPRLGVAR